MDRESGFKKIILLAFLLGGVYLISKFILKTSPFEITLFFLVIFSILGFFYWKQVLLFVPFWILIEGLIRRHFFDSPWVLFIKDGALLLVYVRLFLEYLQGNRFMIGRNNANPLIIVLFSWYLFGLFNPELPSFMQGLVGIKVVFFYIPYLFLTRFLFKDKEQFFKYLYLFILASVPIVIYGFYQYKSGHISTAFHEAYYQDPQTGKMILRPAATFYFSSNFSQYVYIIFTLFLSLININYFNKRRVIFSLIIAANFIGIFISGQRVVWVTIILQFCFFIILGYNISRRFAMVPKTIALLAFIGIILLLLFPGVKRSAEIRMDTMTEVDDVNEIQHIRQDESLSRFINDSPIMGHGPGTASPAARHLKDAEYDRMSRQVEEGHSQIIYEVGYVGWVIFLLILIQLSRYARANSLLIRDRELKMIGIYTTILPLGLIFLYFATGALNTGSTSILFWFSMGFIPTVRELDKKEQSRIGSQ